MKICPVQVNSYNFKAKARIKVQETKIPHANYDYSWYTGAPKQKGQILCDDKSVFNRQTTFFFRDDMDWNLYGEYLRQNFNQPKVNTYVYGCSDGSEAYSMSVLLQGLFGGDAERFFPIYASDIREFTIALNNIDKRDGVRLTPYDYGKLRQLNCFKKVFFANEEKLSKYVDDDFDSGYLYTPYILKKDVTDKVLFKQANVLNEIDSIDSDNPSIVMCRNMWPYIESSEYKECAAKLYKKLAKGSIVVLGQYDYMGEFYKMGTSLFRLEKSNDFPYELEKAGFKDASTKIGTKPRHADLIFEKN